MKKLSVFALFFIFFCAVQAQSGYFIKIEGIEGESMDKDHKGWSDLLSFSQAIHKPGSGVTGASRRRGDVILEDIVCVKEIDKSSPKLQEAASKGTVFPKVEIHLTTTIKGVKQTYYAYELKNVLITSYSILGNNETVPSENISINFEEIKAIYTAYDDKGKKAGNVEYSWKVEKGTDR